MAKLSASALLPRKRKAAQLEDSNGEAITAPDSAADQSETKPRKKTKRTATGVVQEATLADSGAPEELRTDENMVTAGTSEVKPRKKRKSRTTAIPSEELEKEDSEPTKKNKPRTDHAVEEVSVRNDEMPEALVEARESKKTKKSKSRKDSGAPDPMKDENMGDQAKHAILYARSYVLSASTDALASWKFNKTKQKWLVRHALDEQTIPEVYAATVLAYLATVKGGIRDQIAKTCKAVVEGSSAEPLQTEAPDSGEQPAKETASLSKDRAERLLRLLERS